jgi:hypothetical protein
MKDYFLNIFERLKSKRLIKFRAFVGFGSIQSANKDYFFFKRLIKI